MRVKVFSIFVLIFVCSISLIAFGSSNSYLDSLLNSVKTYSVSKVLFASEEKKDSQKTANPENKAKTVERPQDVAAAKPDVPDRIVYFILFNHLVGIKKQAEQLTAEGKTAFDYYELYERQANLDQAQSRVLFDTAQECIDAVTPIDDEARLVISRARANFPQGAGEPSANPPPAELRQLQERKDAAVLLYRDSLRNALGDAKFADVDRLARQKAAPQVLKPSNGILQEKGGTQ